MNRPSLTDIDEVRSGLRHPDSDTRLRAVRDLISTHNPDLIAELADLIDGEADVQVSYEMRKGLGLLNHIRSKKNQSDVNETTSNLAKVEKALKSESAEIVNKAFRYVIQYRLKQFIPLMEQKIAQTNNSYQKNLLLRFLLSLGGELYFNKIVEYLSDDDPRVISTAIEVLEIIGNTKALGYVGMLVTHESNRVQATAMKALYNLGDQNAFKLLEKMALSTHAAYRNSAAYALKEMRLPRSKSLLEKLANDESPAVREKAIEALKNLSTSAKFNAVEKSQSDMKNSPLDTQQILDMSLEETIDWIKEQLNLVSQNKIDIDQFTCTLLQILRDESSDRLVGFVISTLGRMGKKEQIETIRPFLEAENDRIRANTVEALGYLLVGEDLKILLPSFDDHNNRVIGNTVMALSKDYPDESRLAMLNLCQGSNINEQLTAVYCIGALAEEKFLHYCDYLLESSYSEVREKMLKVLEDLSRENATAMRTLKQWKLRMSAFDRTGVSSNEISSESQVSKPKSEKPSLMASIPTNKIKKTTQKSHHKISTHTVDSDFSEGSISISSKHSLHAMSTTVFLILLLTSSLLNVFNILIHDRFEYYKFFLSPFRTIFLTDWLHAAIFIVVPPLVLTYFLLMNKVLIFNKKLLCGLIVGVFLHQYIQLLDTVRLDVGPIANFMGYYASKLYFEEIFGSTGWSLQILNLPWLLLPVFVEGSFRLTGFVRITQMILCSLLILLTMWLTRLNYSSWDKIKEKQIQYELFHLEYRRTELQAILEQNRIDELAISATFNKIKDNNTKNQISKKINALGMQKKRYQIQLEHLSDKIKALELTIDDK